MSSKNIIMSAAGASAQALSDPYFENVSLLLQGDGTNGAQNNTFLDSSTNNFTITRNGNTAQGTFSPYGSLWSNYFDGNGDSIDVPDNAALELGSGDFTIECWIYPTSTNYAAICSKRISGQTYGSYEFVYNGNTDFSFIASTNNLDWQVAIYSSQPAQLNKWNHVAVTRSGSTWKLWLNGTQVASDTYSVTVYDQASTLQIGNQQGNVYPFSGYISNFRLVKGTALYNSTFTPSTTPLTAVSGTSLLTCQSNRFIDNSSNNFTLTVNGDTSVQRFSPFNPTLPYDAATLGGSMVSRARYDFLSTSINSAFNLSSGSWTMESWIYPTSWPSYGGIWSNRDDGNGGWNVTITPSGNFGFYSSGGGSTYGSGGSVIKLNQWHHVALVSDGTNIRHYVNGVLTQTASGVSLPYNSSTPFLIGANKPADDEYYLGYIADFRLVTGSQLYTGSTYTVPTAPLTAITNTSLLLNFTNAGIPDAAMMNDLETVGNAQVSTSVKKYGTGSLAFDGTGDYLMAKTTPNLELGSGNFTIEFWMYPTSLSGGGEILPIAASSDATYYSYAPYIVSNQLYMIYKDASGQVIQTTGYTLSTNTWYHIAYVRNGNTATTYINGTSYGTPATLTGSLTSISNFAIGAKYQGSFPFTGYIDDLRITKGYARYTANFTPPAQALPNY